jgi:hypothetical protein
MTTTTQKRPSVGRRTELGRYTLPDGQTRLVVGQRVDGVVRVSDIPQTGRGRAYLVERELERDGHGALLSLVEDYLTEAKRHASIPMADNVLERYLQHVDDIGE